MLHRMSDQNSMLFEITGVSQWECNRLLLFKSDSMSSKTGDYN
jgi:hypothetical protein